MKAFLALLFPALIFSIVVISPLPSFSAENEYFQLPMKIERYTSSASEVDVSVYIKNAAHYVGFRLVAVEVIAGALNESATALVYINNTRQGPTLILGQTTANYRILPNTAFVIGRGGEKIKLFAINPAYIKSVNLILTR